MIALLAMLLAGVGLARRLTRLADPLTLPAVGLALSVTLLVLGCNSLARLGLSLAQAAPVTAWTIIGLGLLAMGRRRTSPPVSAPPYSGRLVALVWIGALGVFAFTTLCQNLSVDDDYWIHAPLQRLLQTQGVPARHPFFETIQLQGHYGRDLTIAALSSLTGRLPMEVQIWHTSCLHALSWVLLWGGIWRLTGSRRAATWAALLVFCGVNVGARSGLLVTFQNNNAQAYCNTLLVGLLGPWALGVAGTLPGTASSLVAGLTLGALGQVYETHFGLCGLSLGALWLTMLAGQTGPRRPLATQGALCLTTALLVALTQGGPLVHLLESLTDHSAKAVPTAAELSQTQQIPIRFPKARLFQVQLGKGEYQRVSIGYSTYPGLRGLASKSEELYYRPVWSWEVLQIHWLPTLLAPLSLLALVRRRRWVGLFWWNFGLLAYLVPSLVDFGPIFEFELFRWQFACGLGFAAALGVAAADVLAGRTLALGCLLGGSLALASFAPCAIWVGDWLASAYRGPWFPLGAERWLHRQVGMLGASPLDIALQKRLAQEARSGDKQLLNFPEYHPWSIQLESTLVAISGVPCAGHLLPFEDDPVGTAPYRMQPAARAFWSSFDPALLDLLGVTWVVVRPGPEIGPETALGLLDKAHLVRLQGPADQPEGLYRVGARPAWGPTPGDLCVEQVTLAPPYRFQELASGACYTAHLRLRHGPGRLTRLGYAWEDGERARMALTLTEEQSEYDFPLVTPQRPGSYRLRFFGLPDGSPVQSPDVTAEVRANS